MSSRALRKVMREREEQERLKQLEKEASQLEEEQDEEEEDDYRPVTVKKSAFALLGEDGADDDDDHEEDDDDIASSRDQPVSNGDGAAQTASSKKKKKKKKKKAKQAKADVAAVEEPPAPEDELDEIDAALKQLATSGKQDASATAATSANAVDPETAETHRLLAIDTHHLHAQNEMRRLFGRTAIEAGDDDDAAPGGNRRQQRRGGGHTAGLAQAMRGQGGAGGRAGGLSAMALRRNIFIAGKEDWPIATGGGLGMEVEEKRSDGTVLFRYVHSFAYQDVQAQFELAVASMDPQRLILLLRQHPYHISTLLQVSEIAKQERDAAAAGDLLERALFSFGRAAHSTFSKHLAAGTARLDFRRPENREFWLASWRYMQNLTQRATWRTIYEWGRLLLSFSPEDDPYALWLTLDQYALRARQDASYLSLTRHAPFHALLTDRYPHVAFSAALAAFRTATAASDPKAQSQARQGLYAAIGRHPWLAARLCRELALDTPPPIWGAEPRTPRETFLAESYATRARDLWAAPEHAALLLEISAALAPGVPAAPAQPEFKVARNEARHVLLAEIPALIAFVPREFTERLTSASDPLPPPAEEQVVAYVPAEAGSVRTRRARGGGNEEQVFQQEILRDMLRQAQALQRERDRARRGGAGTGGGGAEEDGEEQEDDGGGVIDEGLLARLGALLRGVPGAFGGGAGRAGGGGPAAAAELETLDLDAEAQEQVLRDLAALAAEQEFGVGAADGEGEGGEEEEDEEEEAGRNPRRARVEEVQDEGD